MNAFNMNPIHCTVKHNCKVNTRVEVESTPSRDRVQKISSPSRDRDHHDPSPSVTDLSSDWDWGRLWEERSSQPLAA